MKVSSRKVKALPCILLVGIVFTMSCFIFLYATTLSLQEDSQRLDAGKLPTLIFKLGEVEVNKTYAYTSKVDLGNKDIGILPVNEERIISYISAGELANPTYKILDKDKKVVESGKYSSNIAVKSKLKNDMLYFLVIEGEFEGEKLDYAVRLFYGSSSFEKHQKFADEFSQKLLYKKNIKEYYSFLNFNNKASKDLSHVDKSSSILNLQYSNLVMNVEATKPYKIDNINDFMTSIIIERLLSTTINDRKHYFKSKEYFRISNKGDSSYLLDYDRRLDEYYDGDITTSSLVLGMSTEPIELRYSENDLIFNKNNELWKFETKNNKLSLIFSPSLDREKNFSFDDDYYIKPVMIYENGNLDFALVGRMPSGAYEGRYGIMYLRQNMLTNALEILSFIEVDVPTAVIKVKLGSFFRHESNGDLIFIFDNILYRRTADGKLDKISTGLVDKSYISSLDGGMLAYSNGNNLNIMYTSLGVDRVIKSESEDIALVPVGFWDNGDFTYARYNKSSGYYDEVVVVNSRNEVVKAYKADNFLITGVEKKKDVIGIKRANIETKKPISDEGLLISTQTKSVALLSDSIDDNRGYIYLVNTKDDINPQRLIFDRKVVISNEDTIIGNTKLIAQKDGYVGYLFGKVKFYENDLSEIIKKVDIGSGVVKNLAGEILWQRQLLISNRIVKGMPFAQAKTNEESLKASLYALEQFYSMQANYDNVSLKDNLEHIFNGRYINVSRLNVEQILYFGQVNKPIIIKAKDGEALILLGIGVNNAVVMRPLVNGIDYLSFEAINNMLENGEAYVVY